MSEQLLISSLPGELRAAWLSKGQLEDLVVLRDDKPTMLGDIYLGRVVRLDRTLEAAFVEIGLQRQAFLPEADWPTGSLSEGDAVVVQVIRAASGDKGPKVSTRLSPRPPDLEKLTATARVPARLVRGQDPIARVLSAKRPPDRVVVDDAQVFRETRGRFAAVRGALAERVSLHDGPDDLFASEEVDAAIEALLVPRVPLPSGGAVILEPVSSMTAIDVDSAGHARSGRAADLARAVDMEAAVEIPRQIRLRGLAGLIVIDFLALPARANRQAVVATLRANLKADGQPTRVFPMTASGLVEMTRRRAGPALHELLTTPLGIAGSGRGRDPVSQAFEALRRLRVEALRNPSASLAIEASGSVARALKGPAAPAVKCLAGQLGRTIDVRAYAEEPRPDFEIVLGSRT